MAEKRYGLNRTTLIDYPGKVAATVFTMGCNMRCPFCHNAELVNGPPAEDMLSWEEIYSFIKKRSNLLGGVCISGGEPLLHEDLQEKIADIHSLGLMVKIDTNGTLPERLRSIRPDYIAMDIKTSLGKYHMMGYTGNESELQGRIMESIRIITESGIGHHFRTTVVPGLVTKDDIDEIIKLIGDEKFFVLQGFRPGETLAPEFSKKSPPTSELLDEMKEMFTGNGIECSLKYNL